MKISKKTLLLLIILSQFSLAFAIFQKPTKALPPKEQNEFDYYFFEAQRLKDIGERDAQLDALRMCLKIDSLNAAANNEIGLLYGRLGMFEEADRAFSNSIKQSSKNWFYRIQYIRFLIARKEYEKATEQAEETKKIFKQKEEIYTVLASLYRQSGNLKKAIKTLNQLEVYTGVNELLAFQKFQFYILLEKDKKAIGEIERLVKEYPYEYRYQTLLGDIYMDLGNKEKANEIYQEILTKDPNNPYVYISIASFYESENQPEKANNWIIKSLESERLATETKMEILSKYIDKLILNPAKSEETESLLKNLIEMYPLEELPHKYYSVLLKNQDRNDEALEELESIININPKNEEAWKETLRMLLTKNDENIILAFTDRALKILPEVPEFYFYRSIALFQQNKLIEALNNNKEALKNIKSTTPGAVRSTFYGQIADIYYEQKNKDKAFENYDKALEENPLNIFVMNNYAYYLSIDSGDMIKAERLSAKTVELEPQNSIYLDTYAWILYKKESYSLAQFYIEKAIENLSEEEESSTIYEHCGDIQITNGNVEKAIEMWEKALSFDKENKALQQKIEQNKKAQK